MATDLESPNEDCIFCRILANQVPASIVYEDDRALAFLTLEQPNPYKVIVIPKQHIESLFDLDDETAATIFQATVRVAKAVKHASGCDGLNLVQSNGRAGQQDVFHFHIHIVPRFWNDEIVLDWDNSVAERSYLDQLAAEIRNSLDGNQPPKISTSAHS